MLEVLLLHIFRVNKSVMENININTETETDETEENNEDDIKETQEGC